MNKREELRERVANGEDRETVRKELGISKQVCKEALDHYKGTPNSARGGHVSPISDALGYTPLAVTQEMFDERARTSAAAIELISRRPELKLLQRNERLALCAQIASGIAGEGIEWKVRLDALKLLMQACGDMKEGISVTVSETVQLVVVSNGRDSD
jgi:hypothetical protein